LAVPEIPPITIICGPTCSGKTSVAVALADDFPVEVVSADSRQIIRHLDIGTAKPTSEETARVPHHLIDLIEPGERYSAFRFIDDADRATGDILQLQRLPLVVGGTGLYLRALTDGVVNIEEEAGGEIRERLEKDLERLGPEKLHQRLAEVDPEEAERIHPNNRVRLVRALEIFELTGRPKSELAASGAYKRSRYQFEYHCLLPERSLLYARIEARVDRMIEDGLESEVARLKERGLAEPLRRANVIGYNEMLDYLEDRCSLEEAVAAIKQNHRRYAKRQYTWFRHQIDGSVYETADELKFALSRKLRAWGGIIEA
jgi:tRNA dimethylallyltransferase